MRLRPKCLLKSIIYLQKNKINNFLKINVDLRQQILWWVTIVLEKEFWGIRISLNIPKSVRVFNEVLLKGSHLFLKNPITIINILSKFTKRLFGKKTWITNDGFPTSYNCSIGKSWDTISSIKYCRQFSKFLMLWIHKNSRSLSHKEKLKIKKWTFFKVSNC